MNNPNVLLVELKDKFYSLIINELPEEINIEEYLKIDVGNIVGELLTFPTFLNQISNLKSDIETFVNEKHLQLEIFKANLEKEYKISRSSNSLKTTVADVESYLTTHPEVIKKSEEYIKYQEQLSKITGFYWSAQKKGEILLKVSDRLTSEEFNLDILTKSVNNVLIKKVNPKSI